MKSRSEPRYCKGCLRVRLGSEFYARSAKCKSCVCRSVRANRKRNVEYYREYDKKRWHEKPERRAAVYASLKAAAKRDPERYASYKKWYLIRHPERRAASLAAYIESFPMVHAAHVAVGNAVRDKKLTRGACEVCGATRVHAHHDDYAKPLDVRWLCAAHHAEWHQKNGPGLNHDAPAQNDTQKESA